ncbi:MAG: FecR domain-containing protein [Gammaproteobacteria bacterium]|nr:FecR domain-containing protein [Gammaproteobacteria bacterium]
MAKKTHTMFILSIGLILALGPAHSADAPKEPLLAGKIKIAIGLVQAHIPKRTPLRKLTRGSKIYVGETITTDVNGFAQINFTDNSIATLRNRSELSVDKYIASKKPQEEAMHLNLKGGGLRMISGGIAKRKKRNFQLTTPVATLGVRGTDFSTIFCDKLCVLQGNKEGLYVGVTAGSVRLKNQGGNLILRKGSYSHIPNQFTAPTLIPHPPEMLNFPGASDDNLKALSPEQDLIRVALKTAPKSMIAEIIEAAMNASVPTSDIIKIAKATSVDLADISGPLLAAPGRTQTNLSLLLKSNPNRTNDILTAGYAYPTVNPGTLTKAATDSGVSNQDVYETQTVGTLIRPSTKSTPESTTTTFSIPTSTTPVLDTSSSITLPQGGTGSGDPLSNF